MPVVGLTLQKIEAKKKTDLDGGVKVKTNTKIENVEKKKLPGLKQDSLSISFEYKAEYVSEANENKRIADIVINGRILLVDEKYEEIYDKWQKDKLLSEEVSILVINALLDKCTKKALMLSDDLQLPPPIQLPYAAKKKEE